MLICNGIVLIVTVIILLVWYRKRSGRFNVEKNGKATFEVDNDLYGFMGKASESNLVTSNNYTDKDIYERYSIEKQGQPQQDIKQQAYAANEANPLYEKSTLKSVNPLYKSSNSKSDELAHYETSENSELTYDNITCNSKNVQETDIEYAYCKH